MIRVYDEAGNVIATHEHKGRVQGIVAFHRHPQRNAFRRRDVRQQSRLFVRWNESLRRSPNSTRLLLRLSAMISQYFIGRLPVSLRDEFPTQRNLSANVVGLNDLLARVRCRKTLCP